MLLSDFAFYEIHARLAGKGPKYSPWASDACLACGGALDAEARQRGDLECGTCLLRNLAQRAPVLWQQQEAMNLD